MQYRKIRKSGTGVFARTMFEKIDKLKKSHGIENKKSRKAPDYHLKASQEEVQAHPIREIKNADMIINHDSQIIVKACY